MTQDKPMQIAAKLNPVFDRELIEMINRIPKRERSHVYRQALTEYFEKHCKEDGKHE